MINLFRISAVIVLIFLIHSCKKDKPTPPVVTTTDVTVISYTTATSGGNVTNEGGAPIFSKGVCWNSSADPTIANSKTIENGGSGPFTSNISSLTPNTLYYLRAYATNSSGTGYGDQVSFTTSQIAAPVLTTKAITSITRTTAVSGGNISDDNGGSVTARGVCWDITANPTISLITKTDDTGATGAFTSSITGLKINTTYYVRAYATNILGTSYGNEISFTTSQTTVPTLTTAISYIPGITEEWGGNVTDDGGAAITDRGVCWGTTANPTTTLSKKISVAGTTGEFTSPMFGLQFNTTYYVRAYATNSEGTSYGNEISFTSYGLPTLTTTAASLIAGSTATSGGNVTSDGGATITARGVCWDTKVNPTATIFSNKTSDAGTTGEFTSSITGLKINTTYIVRAYATNVAGTSYGNQIFFTTTGTATAPTLTTKATDISGTTAYLGGNVTSDGGVKITVRGICWSTSPGPTVTLTTKTTDNNVYNSDYTGGFTSHITGLTPLTTYYVRAYATNSVETSYGNEISFTTLADYTGQTGTIIDIDENTYQTIGIDNQMWMAENLKTTRYNDGTPIPKITDNTVWVTLTTGAYNDYNNTPANSTIYGRLYNWYTVDNNADTKMASNGGKNVCPTGWHVPSDGEWSSLTTFLGGKDVAGGKLKETGTTHWKSPNTGATNETGFTALPGGMCYDLYKDIEINGWWWTSTTYTNPLDAGLRYMSYDNVSVNQISSYGQYKKVGLSVRCVRD